VPQKKTKASVSEVRKKLDALLWETGWDKSGVRGLLTPAKARNRGGKFERKMAKEFSLWWTGSVRDDIFWRTGGSGGRATVRTKAGKDTAGQYGDLAATHPGGAPLIDWATIELKRGHDSHTILHSLDATAKSKQSGFEQFIEQANQQHKDAGSVTWLLVHAKDRREPVVWLPRAGFESLGAVGALTDRDQLMPRLMFTGATDVIGFPLYLFFDLVTPDHIRDAAAKK